MKTSNERYKCLRRLVTPYDRKHLVSFSRTETVITKRCSARFVLILLSPRSSFATLISAAWVALALDTRLAAARSFLRMRALSVEIRLVVRPHAAPHDIPGHRADSTVAVMARNRAAVLAVGNKAVALDHSYLFPERSRDLTALCSEHT